MTEKLKTGDILENKYLIISQIGAGGMGVVFEAKHIALNIKVAIKVLHFSQADDPNTIIRFKVEARSAASIRHPNVASVSDYGLTPDRRPFFVMEYLEGESITERIRRKGPFREFETVEIVDQILLGLRSAHRKGIIHRDLKPENVMLAKGEDGEEVVKLLDFGIAKIALTTTQSRHSFYNEGAPTTEQGIVMGTPGYMAPETITGHGVVDPRSDIFSLGVIIFEMLTGRRPFRGNTAHDVMLATVRKPVPKLTLINPAVSNSMERLCITALAKNPKDRYSSVDEFITQMTAAAVGRIPNDARPCKTEVGLPSFIPPNLPQKTTNRGQKNVETMALTSDGQFKPSKKSQVDKNQHRKKPRPNMGTRPISKRRFILPISPFTLVFLGLLGFAAYYLFFKNDPWIEAGDHTQQDLPTTPFEKFKKLLSEKFGEPKPESDQLQSVTIDFNLSPKNALVHWNDTLITDRPYLTLYNKMPVTITISAAGYMDKAITIIPNKDITIIAHLEKKRK